MKTECSRVEGGQELVCILDRAFSECHYFPACGTTVVKLKLPGSSIKRRSLQRSASAAGPASKNRGSPRFKVTRQDRAGRNRSGPIARLCSSSSRVYILRLDGLASSSSCPKTCEFLATPDPPTPPAADARAARVGPRAVLSPRLYISNAAYGPGSVRDSGWRLERSEL